MNEWLDDGHLALMGLSVGVFYVLLAILGMVVHHPFGLRLDPGGNGFHVIVDPLALLLGAWSLWSQRPVQAAAR